MFWVEKGFKVKRFSWQIVNIKFKCFRWKRVKRFSWEIVNIWGHFCIWGGVCITYYFTQTWFIYSSHVFPPFIHSFILFIHLFIQQFRSNQRSYYVLFWGPFVILPPPPHLTYWLNCATSLFSDLQQTRKKTSTENEGLLRIAFQDLNYTTPLSNRYYRP